MRLLVVQERVVVAVLLAADDHQAIERRVGPLTVEDHVQVVAHQLPTDVRRVADELALGA